MKTVSVFIPKQGLSTGKSSIKVDAEGYVGGACKTATSVIERVLGKRLEETEKPELHQTEEQLDRLTDGQ